MRKKIAFWLRSLPLAAVDMALLNLAYVFTAFLYAYLFRAVSPAIDVYLLSWPGVTLGGLVLLTALGVYRTLWSHITLTSLIRLAFACMAAAFWSYCWMRIMAGYWLSPIIPVNAFYVFMTFMIGYRGLPVVLRTLQSRTAMRPRGSRTRVLIVGAGEAADMLIRDFQNEGAQCPHQIVGLVDDNIQKQQHTLRGVKIIGEIADIPELIKKHFVQEIIIAIPSATTQQRKKFIAFCGATGLKVRSMTAVSRVEEANVADLHDLDISDLLGRGEVRLDARGIADYITDSVVLVTGGGGSIGAELCRQIMRFDPRKLIIFDFYENNAYDLWQSLRVLYKDKADRVTVRVGSVQDTGRLEEVFKEFKPRVVFHAAAYKHVPLMEECPELAIQNNVFGTHNVADASIRHNVRRFVMISTDKAVNPTNVMGASKRIAELVIQSMNGKGTEFVAVRFGNVLGSNGSVVPIFRRQIEAGGPVTITHPDIIRYFMTIPEAAQMVIQAGAIAKGGETFVLDMGEPIKILDLANTMIGLAGLAGEIEIIFTGLRPGEKLYEELLISGEGTVKTQNDKIYIGKSIVLSDGWREAALTKLQTCIARRRDLRKVIKEIVPEYVNGE